MRRFWVKKPFSPKGRHPKRSIWATREKRPVAAKPTHTTTYNIFLYQGSRIRKVKTARDKLEAQSWIDLQKTRFPYNHYEAKPYHRKRGFL